MAKILDRSISPFIQKALATMPVVVLTGMRQVGKSTLLKNDPRFASYKYYSLDDLSLLESFRLRPEIVSELGDKVIIDEAQRCPEILLAIKAAVDKSRLPGRFILSGSANFSLLKNVAESLAGRAVYVHLGPMTRQELSGSPAKPSALLELFQRQTIAHTAPRFSFSPRMVFDGGMPPVVCEKNVSAPIWFKGFIQTYLERDLRDLSAVADLASFNRFMRIAALRTAKILNISELGRDCGQNSTTTSRYMDLLETSFVVRKVPPYLNNRSQRLVKAQKLLIADSGIACSLCGISSTEELNATPYYGALFETFVLQNSIDGILAADPFAQIFYWHIQGRYEVDCIIESQGKLVAIEVKSSSRFNNQDFSPLRTFLETAPKNALGVLVYCGEQTIKIEPNIWAVPVSVFL
ncbi:MAG: ATP-binding protein [Chitinivibrionales bacterium]|nr:ATP-binding protein [Chitinivibrionales bacterium]